TRFYREILKRYPETFPYIAVGNEPNSKTFWDGTYEEYVRLFQTAAKAIHETDPTVKVIDGGMASESWGCIAVDRLESGAWETSDAIAFLRGYYATTRQYQKIQTATDAQITSEYLKNPTNVSECHARRAYFQGLVGHADAVNFHFYEDGAYLGTVIDYLEETMQNDGWKDPVIVTNELGNKQKNNADYDVAGQDQARDLRQKVEYATDRGLPLIIWFSVNGKDSITGGFLSTHDRDGTPFEAAREYRRFLEEQALILK
ncbi:MAG: hypothetical protein HYZ08_03400, partial [Candidatus Kerfeldbacteria bacterium]|nr:hypothetical protein [Candidatus Kerfeldbacteria bacterium]